MIKKVLITSGGTGGHIFPAIGLAQELQKADHKIDIFFMAGGLQTNRYFDRKNFSYQEVACSRLISKNPLKLILGLLNLFKGVGQSIRFMKQYRPDVVVGFGSFYTVSTLLAAKFLKIPIVLHEANSLPGKANKWFAPYAAYVGILFPATKYFIKGNTLEVGLPLREGYLRGQILRKEALDYFQLDETTLTVLIFGGSQGSNAINNLLKEALWNTYENQIQVIHLTGDKNVVEELTQIYSRYNIRSCVKPYEGSMNKAWEAADLFIGRAGASTIAESMEFEVPGILIPYPHATENHQEKNADFFVEEVGGGLKLLEKNLTSEGLSRALLCELKEIKTKKKAIQEYKKRPGRKKLSQLILGMIGNSSS